MKFIVKILACVAVVSATAKVTGGDVAVEQRKEELAAALVALQEPQHSDSHIEHPGWYNPQVRDQLREIVDKYPKTDEALTAELWLATAELEVAQGVADHSKKHENLLLVASAYSRVIEISPSAWQAKAARIGRAGALLAAQQWAEARDQVTEILADIPSYTDLNP
jgi:hypothetical protein